MYKRAFIVTFIFLLYVSLDALGQFEQGEVTATGEEIKGYDAQVKAGNEFLDTFNANFESIKTWQGHTDVVKKIWKDKEKTQPLYHLEYGVDFHLDNIKPVYRYISTGKYGISYRTGERVPLGLSREATLMQKDPISHSSITTYTSHHYMDEVPQEERFQYVSTLKISTDSSHLRMRFYPTNHGLPYGGIEEIKDIFAVFDLDKSECRYRAKGIAEEEIREILAQIREDGFPKHWNRKLSFKDNYLYFDTDYNTHYTWDLSRGAWPTLFTSGTHRWTCELQRVSSIWIPKKITIEIGHSDGTYSTEEMIWTEQKLNETIDEKLWTVPQLGVRRGDQGYDARTETSFIVEGEEYLPSLEEEEAEALIRKPHRWTPLRCTLMTLGVLMILAAYYMKYRDEIRRKKQNKIESGYDK